jgi:hypothetical protein
METEVAAQIPMTFRRPWVVLVVAVSFVLLDMGVSYWRPPGLLWQRYLLAVQLGIWFWTH